MDGNHLPDVAMKNSTRSRDKDGKQIWLDVSVQSQSLDLFAEITEDYTHRSYLVLAFLFLFEKEVG